MLWAAPDWQTQTAERVKRSNCGLSTYNNILFKKLYFTDIFTCTRSLKGLLDKIPEHLLPLLAGATEPNHFADLLGFLQRKETGRYVLRMKTTEHTIIILLLMLFWETQPMGWVQQHGTYHNSGNKGDGHWEHLLHFIFAGFGSWPGQVVTQTFNVIHDLLLK